MAFPLKIPILASKRTAIGRAIKGGLKDTRPEELAAQVLQALLKSVPGISPKSIDDVIMGCAMPEAEQGLNVARNIILAAGLPDEVPGVTVNRFCASGLEAIAQGAQAIHSGIAQVVIAGGVESMSSVPMSGNKVSLDPQLVEHRPEAYISMGHTAERIAKRFDVSREHQDLFGVRSHSRALKAISERLFVEEIIPVQARSFEHGRVVYKTFEVDECPRAGTTVEALGKLKPVFSQNGSVTAGNSSPLNDGAAASLLVSDKQLQQLGVKPLGFFRGYAVAGVPPDIMGIGPIPAIQKLLKLVGLQIQDIDLFEINEAFAAQALYVQRELKIPDDKLNINGGALALGHPLGCTGARLTSTLLHGLKKAGKRLGIVSMCIGGGMGAAGLFELA